MHLYLVDSAVKIGLSENRLTVKSAADDSLVRDFPFDDVDGISVFGKPQFSTPVSYTHLPAIAWLRQRFPSNGPDLTT